MKNRRKNTFLSVATARGEKKQSLVRGYDLMNKKKLTMNKQYLPLEYFLRALKVEYDFPVFKECTAQSFCFADCDFRHSLLSRNRFGKAFFLGNEA